MDANQYSAQKTKQMSIIEKSKSAAKMKIVTCSCGTKILVVPDLAAMNKAINNHLSRHNCDVVLLLEEIFKAISE
jgi:hypothetical protein